MLDLDDDHPREVRTSPFLIELVRVFLTNLVVAGEFEALVVIRFEIGIWWRLTKAAKIRREVSVKNHEWITRVRTRIKALWQQYVGAEVHRTSPKISQQLALNLDVFDVLGFFRRSNRRNLLIKFELDRLSLLRIDS